MEQTKKLTAALVVMTIFQAIIGLGFSLYIMAIVFSFTSKQANLNQPLSCILSILAFLIYSSAYFMFTIYPGLVKKKNAFSKVMEKHSFSFLVINLFIIITIVSINNKIAYDKDNLKDLVGVEWAIYGITIGLFTIWEAVITSKNEEIDDPDKFIGLERLEKIKDVKLKKILNSSAIFTAILLSLNTIAIIIFTALMHIIDHTKIQDLVVKSSIISFYFCTNSLVITFVECLFPMFISKFKYDSKHSDKAYDDEFNEKIAFNEEISYRAKKFALELAKQENTEQTLDEFKKELIEKRKNEGINAIIEKTAQKDSNSKSSENDTNQNPKQDKE